MVDIFFILLIGGVFFWDLIEFKKNQNIKVHRLLIPIGFLGSLVSIYLSKLDNFVEILNDSLVSIIVSIFAFLVIIAIKLFLSKPVVDDKKSDKFDEVLELLERIKNSNREEVYIKEIKSEIESIKKHKSNNSKEIEEIKQTLNSLLSQFDEDVKRFQEESISIKGNSIKQIEVVAKLLSKQTKIMEDKILYFENKLQKIENKKFTIDDSVIHSFSKNIELSMSKMDINLDTIKRNIDALYDKEKIFEVLMDNIENKLISLNTKIKSFNELFDKEHKIENILSLNKDLKYVLDGFADIKEQFTLSLHKIKINSDMVNEAKEEIFENLENSFLSIEDKIIDIVENNINKKELNVSKKTPQEIAISKYNSSLNEN
jgi:hypothetical protein